MIKFNIPPYIEGTDKYVMEVMRSGEIAGDNVYTKKCEAILKEKREKGQVVPAAILNRYLEKPEDGKMAAMIFGRTFGDNLSAAEKSRLLSENLQRLRKNRLQKELPEAGDPKTMQALIMEMAGIKKLRIPEELV